MLYRGPMGGGAASGALGAMVASHNAGGQYLRARVTPTDPATSKQVPIRNAVGNLATRWTNTLTPTQRNGWIVYASLVPVVNRLGDTTFISGVAMFIRCNTPRLQAGVAIVDAYPVVYVMGDFGGGTLTVGALSTAGTLTYAANEDWNGSGSTTSGILLYASRPQTPATNFFKGPYQYVGRANSSTGSSTFTLPFATGPVGSKLFWQARVTRADARLSPVFRGLSVGP